MKTLTKVIFKNSKRTNKQKGIILSSLAFAIVFGSLSIAMITISYTITKKLIEINQSYTFINILLLMNFLILFGKSIFESLNVLYFSKDLKILLRMPIKPKDIVNSKLLNMITSEYEMEIIMLAIPMIVYGILTKASMLFYIYMIAILITLPVIPILLTSLIIAIIMRVTNKIKNKNKVMYISIIITTILIGIIISLFGSNQSQDPQKIETIIMQANGISETISDYFVLIKPIIKTIINYNNVNGLKNLIIYIIENLAIYTIILNIISKIYLKGAIGTTINSKKSFQSNIENLNLNDFKPKKIKKAYIQKELKTIIRTPIFLIQCIIIPIIYPLLIIISVIGLTAFASNNIGAFASIYTDLYKVVNTCIGVAIFLSIGQVFYMMNFSSIIAISRESKNAILTKTIPIKLNKQFKLKTSIGIKINILAGTLVTILYFIFSQKVITSIMIFITLVLINSIGEKLKLLVDLQKPQIRWDNEYTMMKQNTNVMYILFYTLLTIGILIGISKIINQTEIYLIILITITSIINILINKHINKNEHKIFKKLY